MYLNASDSGVPTVEKGAMPSGRKSGPTALANKKKGGKDDDEGDLQDFWDKHFKVSGQCVHCAG